jgi:Fe-S oxidoreductase
VARMARMGSRFPALFNWFSRNRLSRWLNEKMFAIDRRRLPPALARRSFFKEFGLLCKQRPGGDFLGWNARPDRPAVLLFVDTFAEFYEPKIAWDAFHSLRSLGFQVVPAWPNGFERWEPANALVEPSLDAENSGGATGEAKRMHLERFREVQPNGVRCCGRPLISNGMLTQAAQNAEQNVAALYPWAAAGKPIIACEPSCILTIKDDYPALLRGAARQRAQSVAAMCRTFEELAEESIARSILHPGPAKILVQGHCHQQSLVGMGPTMRLLRRMAGTVVNLDAGCCGMAGSFGYEKEHYDISRLVGEQRLFPAVRQAKDTVIVAPGFSCRLQIEHFTGRRSVHPATLLWSLMKRDTSVADVERS